jgi:hypothetical protein
MTLLRAAAGAMLLPVDAVAGDAAAEDEEYERTIYRQAQASLQSGRVRREPAPMYVKWERRCQICQ